MSFGFSMRGWERTFDAEELGPVREFVARVNPSQEWEELIRARPTPRSISLWNDFAGYWDEVLSRYGVVGPYDALHLLPVDFGERAPTAPRLVNLRPGAERAWLVLEARWVHGAWPGHADAAYARRSKANAKRFAAWMRTLGSDDVDQAIEAFLGRGDAFEIVTAHLELEWIDAARAACEARCPVALHG